MTARKNRITVGELVDLLNIFDRSTPVVVTWESITRDLTSAHVYPAQGHVVIDADECHYKDEFVSGGLEIPEFVAWCDDEDESGT